MLDSYRGKGIGTSPKKGAKECEVKRGVGNVLDQVSHIHGHLLHSGVVEGLNVPERSLVIFSHHVDGNTFSAEAATTSNPKK